MKDVIIPAGGGAAGRTRDSFVAGLMPGFPYLCALMQSSQ